MTTRPSNYAEWVAIAALAFIFALVITIKPAHAFPYVGRSLDLDSIHDCIERVTGWKRPDTEPHIIYSSDWSRPASGMCCRPDGTRASYGEVALSTYRASSRTIEVYAGARASDVVHEIAADQIVQGSKKYHPAEYEAVAYRAAFLCGGSI